jgi:molybdopterin-guanine dinucleotide biosynthesis protein A
MKHQKHTKLIKPEGGKFHQNEWAILGAPCSIIKGLAFDINEGLKSTYKIGFIDEIHQVNEADMPIYHSEFTNKLTHQEHRLSSPQKPLFYTQYFRLCDAVLVNGNHFIAGNQIVIINQKKKESLSRKLDRLTHIEMILLDSGESTIHDFLADFIDPSIPIYGIHEIDKIIAFFEHKLKESIPPLDGLVLLGGKSMRMGEDKSSIAYRGIPQYEYAHDLLSEVSRSVYFSGIDNGKIGEENNFIQDTFTGLGPYGGILSAFRKDPNRALITLPIDTPLIDLEIINTLVKNRDVQKLATCFHNPATNFPEPLITIWEPKAYPVLLNYLAMGYSCPRKVLINEDIHKIECPDPIKLKNANTPEERAEIEDMLNKLAI